MVRDIAPGGQNGDPRSLVPVNGALYFAAKDPEHGRELWVSDGTERGTRLVADLVPGPTNSKVRSLVNRAGQLVFAFDDPVVGSEPWALTCGNGVVEMGEACDDGSRNGTPRSCCSGLCEIRQDDDVDGDGTGDRCDLAEGALELELVRLQPLASAAGTLRVKASGLAPLSFLAEYVASGATVEVIDGGGTRHRVHWPVARCRSRNDGSAVCRDKTERAALVLTPVVRNGQLLGRRFRIAFDSTERSEAPTGPVLVRLTLGRTHDREGTLDTCEERTGALVCRAAE
jgi:ELWxxDGT repeat protein